MSDPGTSSSRPPALGVPGGPADGRGSAEPVRWTLPMMTGTNQRNDNERSDLSADPPELPRFAVLDIETSGLSTRWHRILQVAVVIVEDGRVVDEWSSLARLRWRFGRVGPRRVHGIDRTMLRGAPRLGDVVAELAHRVDGAVVTAHNVAFDWPFIERAARRAGVELPATPRLCTLRLSRSLDPQRQLSHRLADACARYGIANDRPHDALHDARATAQLLPHLLAGHEIRSAADLDTLYERR